MVLEHPSHKALPYLILNFPLHFERYHYYRHRLFGTRLFFGAHFGAMDHVRKGQTCALAIALLGV